MKIGAVLGGVAKGAIDTYTSLSDNQRKNTAAKDLAATNAREREYWGKMDATDAQDDGYAAAVRNLAQNGRPEVGSPIGSHNSVPLADFLSGRGLDMSAVGNAKTAADVNGSQLFRTLQSGPRWGNSAGGDQDTASGAIPVYGQG